ncbi:tryptophan 2,3-dioxygenase family protein [Kibdelosporangium philippinense]|uniref:Tryptophan 2,3-dioxygenase family protein n=1 Tax=Kibdelosporangium philippinense TaxID=211113 RepID=A0ABS8Z3T5_9PSEU|nr:tryptophan 2,3-dioxygenase family protein [Kibdelosporangium philippinense]MCE7002475.1 tryptophan 2,3-dioxygenase family protein [Kibdelosporangium philippinense]
METPTLPGRCAEVAQLQGRAGKQALMSIERDLLTKLYDEACADQGLESEVMRLLTRPFSPEPIPEYYRYANAHVYAWFLDQHPAGPVAAAVLAMDATLADLEEVERRASPQLTETDHSEERLSRLAVLRAQVRKLPVETGGDRTAAEVIDEARDDEMARWQAYVLTRCSGFLASNDHHEHVFLRSVQACELAFHLIRYFTVRARTSIERADGEAHALMAQLVHYAELPNHIFHMLQTLTPDLFLTFRDATGEASAVQSLNYHMMELVMYGFDARKLEAYMKFPHLHELTVPPLRLVPSLRDQVAEANDPELTEAMAAVERTLLTWRGRHYGFGRRYLPDMKGSGGTEGAGYLKRFVHKDNLDPEPVTTATGLDLLAYAYR